MPDPYRLEDDALRNVEKQLAGIAMTGQSPRRDEVLYQCGQGAARGEERRKRRRLFAIAASLGPVLFMFGAITGRLLPSAEPLPAQHQVSRQASDQQEKKLDSQSLDGWAVVISQSQPTEFESAGRLRIGMSLDQAAHATPRVGVPGSPIDNAEPAAILRAGGSLLDL